MAQMVFGVIASLLGKYIAKLATAEFAHWALFKIAESIVESTDTKEDDEWLAKIKETVEK